MVTGYPHKIGLHRMSIQQSTDAACKQMLELRLVMHSLLATLDTSFGWCPLLHFLTEK